MPPAEKSLPVCIAVFFHKDLFSDSCLFRSQGCHRITLGRLSGGDQSADQSQDHTEQDQDQSRHWLKHRIDIAGSCQMVDQSVARYQQL